MNQSNKPDLTKEQILEKILNDKSRVVKVVPVGGYSTKLQTVWSNKVEA